MNKTSIKTRMFLIAIVAIVVSALIAHTGVVFAAIASGLVASLVFCYTYLKYVDDKTTIFDMIAALAGCQMGWAALLI